MSSVSTVSWNTRGDLMADRHCISKLLLRQGIVYSGGKAWTGKHQVWPRTHMFTVPGLQLAYDTAYDPMLATVDRRDRLDAAIAEMSADSVYTPVVTRLGCLRGTSTLTAFGLAVEIGDWRRLTGRSIGAYLGLVPTESSSGASRSQGSITKTGNAHARRLADRGRMASPSALPPSRCGSTAPVGAGHPAGTGARTARRPPLIRPVAEPRSATQASGGR